MSRFSNAIQALSDQTSYTLMRGVARFRPVRNLVAGSRRLLHTSLLRRFISDRQLHIAESAFPNLDYRAFVTALQQDGIAHGLKLPSSMVSEIQSWADRNPCYGDRDPRYGFTLSNRVEAEARMAKPILLAQYFNTTSQCPAIEKLAVDPILNLIAASYLQSLPSFVGANLWWTFPVDALEADRDQHAHFFHRDVDDFRFFKFFFYLTDVPAGEGAHVCVATSHNTPPVLRPSDHWKIRRYRDDEIHSVYFPALIQEICGPAGTGFAENTLCIHKRSTPKTKARLLLQLQFALFDHGVMHDQRLSEALKSIV